MSVIGDNIRALREERNLTQQQLAEAANVTRETVVKWESGVIGNIRDSNLDHIREAYSLSIDDLRSETRGLAAQLARKRAAGAADLGSVDALPLRALGTNERLGVVELPPAVLLAHPRGFVVRVACNHVDLVLPAGCHAVIDPELPCAPGAVALVRLPEDEVGFWRVNPGRTKTMLTPEQHVNGEDDRLYGADEVQVVGPVVWWQAPEQLQA